jgi:hypothetical protein
LRDPSRPDYGDAIRRHAVVQLLQSASQTMPPIGRASTTAAVAATLKLRKERRNHAGVFDSNNFGLITREQPAPQRAPELMGKSRWDLFALH